MKDKRYGMLKDPQSKEFLIVLECDNRNCLKCRKSYTCIHKDEICWCKICSVKYVQEKLCTWSGNKKIDSFIKEEQQGVISSFEFFEWIPYDQFENVKSIGKREFVTIYSAIWKDGCLNNYNEETHEFSRNKNTKVVLKCLNNSKYIDDLFSEVFIYSIHYNIYINIYIEIN